VVQYWGTSFIAVVVVSEEVTGNWEVFHSEVLGDCYSSTDVIMVIKSQAGPVACMGGKNVTTGFGVETEGMRLLGRPKFRRIILKWFLNKYDGRARSGLIRVRIGTSGEML